MEEHYWLVIDIVDCNNPSTTNKNFFYFTEKRPYEYDLSNLKPWLAKPKAFYAARKVHWRRCCFQNSQKTYHKNLEIMAASFVLLETQINASKNN